MTIDTCKFGTMKWMFPRRLHLSSFIPFVLFWDSSNGIVFERTAFPFLHDGIIWQAKACGGKDVEGVMMVRLCEHSIHARIYSVSVCDGFWWGRGREASVWPFHRDEAALNSVPFTAVVLPLPWRQNSRKTAWLGSETFSLTQSIAKFPERFASSVSHT